MAKRDFEPNKLFWTAREALGLSRLAVADHANQQPIMASCEHQPMTENWIGRIEQGRIGGGMCAERLAALCLTLRAGSPAGIGLVAERRRPTRSAPSHPRASHRRQGEPEPDRDAWAVQEHAADCLDVSESPEELVVILDSLTESANRLGWTAVQPLVRRNLEAFDRLRRSGRETRGLLAFAEARWAEFMSWASDNGGADEGDNWLNRAHVKAIDANDQALKGYMLMRRSQKALDNGDARRAVDLSRKALREEDLPPKVRALCLARLAEGLALSGHEESLEVLSSATRRTDAAVQRPEDLIAQHCDHRYVLAARARCLHLLGRPDEAVALIDEIFTDAAPVAPVDRSMWMVYRADALAHRDARQAAAGGIDVLSSTSRGTSARAVRALLPLAVRLRPHAHHGPVGEFLTAHRAALADLLPK
ncbi:hypothetical protein ACGFJ7_35410 [Actinoplanes sp. NPDC048988]|uniref:hypothetical protein n=1 Tax=Actinoplanes sp. NPDC048988 TaxID=3363901 RepID=UPI00371BD365